MMKIRGALSQAFAGRCAVLCLLSSVLCLPPRLPARAAVVTMNDHVLPPADIVSITTNGVGDGAATNPYVYPFPTADGLEMGSYKIYGNDASNKSVKLDLNGGSITGTMSATAFDFATGDNSSYTAFLCITNVANVQIGKIWCYNESWNNPNCGAGGVTIGSTNAYADKIEIAEILCYLGSYDESPLNDISIYSTNDVLIWDGTTVGDIRSDHYDSGVNANVGSITVWHDGRLLARDILANSVGGLSGNIDLNGDILDNGSSGNLDAGTIDVSYRGTKNAPYPSVTIAGYTDVTVTNAIRAYQSFNNAFGAGPINISASMNIAVNSVDTHSYGAYAGGGAVTMTTTGGTITIAGSIDTSHTLASDTEYAGNVTLTAAGNIMIGGSIDMDEPDNAAYEGILALTNTAANATIQVASLDLDLVKTATFSAGSHKSYVRVLSNFPTNTPNDGQLNAVTGQTIYYDSSDLTNAYLTSDVYPLASGGILRPDGFSGTLIIFR